MDNRSDIEQEVEKKCAQRDKKKRKRMIVTGKSVFSLQRLMAKHPPKIKKK